MLRTIYRIPGWELVAVLTYKGELKRLVRDRMDLLVIVLQGCFSSKSVFKKKSYEAASET